MVTTRKSVEFIQSMYQDCVWSYGPQQITEQEATYNLQQWRQEGLQIPKGITPALFCLTWNLFYECDTEKTGGASA